MPQTKLTNNKVISLDKARENRSFGYISLHRSLLECSFANNPNRLALWVHMLMLARYKPTEVKFAGANRVLKIGQFIAGREHLSRLTGLSNDAVKHAINFFKKEGMISVESTSKGSVFTILNYAKYQEKYAQPDAQLDAHLDAQLETSNYAAYSDISPAERPAGCPAARPLNNKVNKYNNTLSNERVSDKRLPDCPHRELLALWQEIIPETVQHNPQEWKSGRVGYKDLAARWKSGFTIDKADGSGKLYTDRESGLAWWRGFFNYLRKSGFLMNECKPFSLEWSVKSANFIKIKEGRYHA